MRAYRELTMMIQTMRSGKSSLDKSTEHLMCIYDRIARKGNRGNP